MVRLREAERRLRLRCKELELRVGEGELSLKELKLAMRRVILDADRRRTQQHQKHQSDIQLLLQKLKGGGKDRGSLRITVDFRIFLLKMYLRLEQPGKLHRIAEFKVIQIKALLFWD